MRKTPEAEPKLGRPGVPLRSPSGEGLAEGGLTMV